MIEPIVAENAEAVLTKLCTICNQDKSLESFTKLRSGKYGRHSQCKDCRKNQRQQKNYPRPPDTSIIQCYRCQRQLTADNFNADKSSSTGLQTYCKQCHKNFIFERRSTFEGTLFNVLAELQRVSKKRGIDVDLTITDLQELYQIQNGLCAITGILMTSNYKVGSGKKIALKNISVDRLDAAGSYTRDNVRLVCYAHTLLQDKLTREELVKLFQGFGITA